MVVLQLHASGHAFEAPMTWPHQIGGLIHECASFRIIIANVS